MGYELIVCEKPSAARKISSALADKSAKKLNNSGVPYFKLEHDGKEIVVASAVGHLYSLEEKKKTYAYPSFDIEWKPTYKISKSASYTKKYTETLIKLAKDASDFTVACDYDIEGEVIGLNVIKYACKKKDGYRMKFSTLTKPDLIKAYDNKQDTLDWGQANAGETRHFLDWFFGINLSRALTLAMKAAGNFKVMSTGRVQGPALKLIVDKEKEIMAFVPEPYSQIELDGKINGGKIKAMHEKDKFFDQKIAEEVYLRCKDEKVAKVESVQKKEVTVQPPFPFDLTSLQIEAHKCLRISPKVTLEIAQALYINGYTSYPRTSSQQLPKEIGYEKIIRALSKQKEYVKETDMLLSKKGLQPNNGKKTDPAHPAVYPTGLIPEFSNEKEKKVYDLIVRRFLATFGDPAIRETMTVKIDCNRELFITKGTTTAKQGWFEIYGKHVMLKETELPNIKDNDLCNIIKISKLEKETTPPKRYTEASIIKKLEKENLGTKATRATIIETLLNRKFIEGKAIKATDIGIKTSDTLNKYCPEIQGAEMTRHFEEEMEKIRQEKATPKNVLDDAKKELLKILDKFKTHEKDIGDELRQSYKETVRRATTIGKCYVCNEGDLVIKKGKYGRFIGCSNYPKCKTIINIPKTGTIKPSKNVCNECSKPMLIIKQVKKTPQELCVNPDCPSKQNGKSSDGNGKTYEEEGMTCPICKEGKMVLRKSFYGQFLGCNRYPKCKTMMKIVNGKVDVNPINNNGKNTVSKVKASGAKGSRKKGNQAKSSSK